MSKKFKKIVGPVRCIYPKLHDPKPFDGQKPEETKYNIKLLVPKEDKEVIKEIKDLIKDAITATSWGADIKKKMQKAALMYETDLGYNDNCMLKDGDLINKRRKEEEKDLIPAYAEHYVISASRRLDWGAPTVVGSDNSIIHPTMIRAAIISGFWVNAQIQVRIIDRPKTGVSFTLIAVQKVKEDTQFGQEVPFSVIESEDEIDDTDENPFEG